MQVNAYNMTNEVAHIVPKTVMATIWAHQLEVEYLVQDSKFLSIKKEEILNFGEELREEITGRYPKVGDFNLHPINHKLTNLGVRSTGIKWENPPDQGMRTNIRWNLWQIGGQYVINCGITYIEAI